MSLVAQTVQTLKDGIESSHWRGQLPSERDLCESLQISRRTLRAALVELEITGCIQVVGRQPRQILQSQAIKDKTSTKKVIGVLSPSSFLSLSSPIAYVMDTMRARLTSAGYYVRFHIDSACYSNNPSRSLGKCFADHPSSAWLVLSAQEPLQRWLKSSGHPCIVLGSTIHGITLPSIDTDYFAACHHAGGLLLRSGHRNVALVLPEGRYGGDIASEEGFRAALATMPGAHVRVLRHASSASSVCSLLDKILNTSDPPTAYVIARAAHVMTVMMHLMRRGRRIPEDVTILSRDDDPILEATSPRVARYAMQPKQLANRIALALGQLAETGILSRTNTRLVPEYVPGETLHPIIKHPGTVADQ